MEPMAHELSHDEARHVARLARLALSDEALESQRVQLGAILEYVERLRKLDLDGVEPMTHAGAPDHTSGMESNRWDADEPGPALDNDTLMRIAPAIHPPFIRVPKVIDGGGGGA